MSAHSTAYPGGRFSFMPAILLAGLISGSIDLAFAFIYNGARGFSPLVVLQSIASGWLGPESFKDGTGSAALGVVSHYLILTVAATIYLAASRRTVLLTQRAIVCGMLYGIAIYLFMHLVVLPLSAAPKFKFSGASTISDFSVHILLLGPAIALTVRKYSMPQP